MDTEDKTTKIRYSPMNNAIHQFYDLDNHKENELL